MSSIIDRAKSLRKGATMAEKKLWSLLRRKQLKNYKFRRQTPVSGFIVDFICFEARLIIEVDGRDHEDKRRADAYRTDRLSSMGYAILRFWNHEIFSHTDKVIEKILSHLL